MAVDATMRKLKIPSKFMPYLEKHRIYELFHDLGDKLAMEQPADPVKFLKECLEHLNEGRDQRLILFMAPPYLDKTKLAQKLSQKTGYGIVSRYLMEAKGNFYDPGNLAEFARYVSSSSRRGGWIFADFPNSVEEAKCLIKVGVFPTHAFLLVQDNSDTEHVTMRTVDASSSMVLEFNNSLYRLKEIFRSSLKVIKIKDKSMDEVVDLCAKLAAKMPPRLAPKLFRVALLGPRGSRRRTLAKLLQKRFNMIHVDMNNVLNTAKVMENDAGDEIRYCDINNYDYNTKMVFQLLKDRLEQNDCMEHGYVLTNFPTCVEDFIFLDSLDTPPNRVIFLNVDAQECFARVQDRVVNMHTGDLHSKKETEGNSSLKSQTLPHPDDESCKVTEEIRFYLCRVESMLQYCGGTCSKVDGRGPIKAVFERVEAVLVSSPTAHPRSSSFDLKRPSFKPRMSYPISRTEVVPLIDGEELIRRFKELKGEKGSDSEILDESMKSSGVEGLDHSVYIDDATESSDKFEEK